MIFNGSLTRRRTDDSPDACNRPLGIGDTNLKRVLFSTVMALNGPSIKGATVLDITTVVIKTTHYIISHSSTKKRH